MLVGEAENIDLEFDDRFMSIDHLISEHEVDFDAPLRKGQDPFDWGRVASDCEQLSKESNDLRVAVWWLRARSETGNIASWAEGLRYIFSLLQKPEDLVFPKGDGEVSTGELHSTVLGWLCSSRSLAVFKRLPLTADGDWRVASLLPGDGLNSVSENDQGKLSEALAAAQERTDFDFDLLVQAKSDLESISALLDERSSDGGGDFSELISTVGHALHRLAPMTSMKKSLMLGESSTLSGFEEKQAFEHIPVTANLHLANGLSIHSREEVRLVLSALERYYHTYESGHPAPIFIQRLLRMVDMSFELLMRELFSESEKLLGRLIKPVSD